MVSKEPTNREIYELLREMQKGQKSLEEGQKSLEEGQKSLEEGQRSLGEGQKSIRQEMHEGFGVMEVRLSVVETEVRSLKGSLDQTRDELLSEKDWGTGIVDVETEQGVGAHQTVRLEKKVEGLEARVADLEEQR